LKPAPFDYHAPTTVAEVVSVLEAHGDEAKVLAGGQSLLPMLAMRLARFEVLVDTRRVAELRRVEIDDTGVTLGAMVKQCEIEERPDIGAAAPLLARATPHIGHFQIRSRGTVGGSIAHADPAAEYPAVALALDAQLEATGPRGSRSIPASAFFVGTWTTTLEADELLTSVRFPSWGPASGFAVEEVARRHGDFAIAGACVGVRLSGDTIDKAAIGIFGLGSTPIRAEATEAALVGAPRPNVDVEEAGRIAVDKTDPPDDLHASSALRRRIGAAVVTRALRRALEEAHVA
jgi:aerobic carbon-monoxide dehydrogenase medium subunit